MPYGIPHVIQSDYGWQFVSKFFTSFYTYLKVKKFTTTSFHPHTNSQVEIYSKTLLSRLWLYTADNQQSWNIFVQQLTYTYNCQVRYSTNETSISPTLSRYPPGPTKVVSLSTLPDEAANTTNSNILPQNMAATSFIHARQSFEHFDKTTNQAKTIP